MGSTTCIQLEQLVREIDCPDEKQLLDEVIESIRKNRKK